MKEIQLTARLKVHDGKLEEFKIVAAVALETVREKDTGVLETVREKDTGVRQYDWFLSADQSECVVRERYVDSQALLDHLAIVSEQLGALVGLSDLSLELYGDPSPELLQALNAFNPSVLSYLQGL